MTPQRIQRKRTKGWRMPEGAVYVGRGSKWGNPYYVGPGLTPQGAAWRYRDCLFGDLPWPASRPMPTLDEIRSELRGKNLACWCPENQPCHGDVLLELANKENTE